jgi:hypothetical protein
MAWTSPSTWTTAAVVTAAQLNTQLRDNLKAIGDPWTSFTPVWTASTTNPTLGNGSKSGFYLQAGKLVVFKLRITFGGTTTSGAGGYSFTLPVAAVNTDQIPTGGAIVFDTSANDRRTRSCFINSPTTCGAMDEAGVRVGGANPFTWANGDTIDCAGTYEAA